MYRTNHEITISEMESNEFKIGGKNETSLIRRLNSINKQTIQELEQKMKPSHGSESGFLGEKEKLLDILVKDNDFVLSQGLTHQSLAEPLKVARTFAHEENHKLIDLVGKIDLMELLEMQNKGNVMQYEGYKYQVKMISYRGIQNSPFNDNTKTNCDVIITNIDNKENLAFSGLVPDMIERYGFYEGKETPYRVEPSQIIKTFPHLAQKARKALREDEKNKY